MIPPHLYRRGRALEAQGRKKGAIDDFVAALALDRDLEPGTHCPQSAEDQTHGRNCEAAKSGRSRTSAPSCPGQPSVRERLIPQQVIDASSQFEKKEFRDRAEKGLPPIANAASTGAVQASIRKR